MNLLDLVQGVTKIADETGLSARGRENHLSRIGRGVRKCFDPSQ